MKFTTATQAPVVVSIDGADVSVPRMTLKDWSEWGAEVDRDRQAAALAGFSPIDRFKILSVSSVAPTQIGELAALVFTPAGAARIVRRCMERAGVKKDTVDAVLAAGDPGELQLLAEELASVADKPVIPPSGAPGNPPAAVGGDSTFADAGSGGMAGNEGGGTFAEEGRAKDANPLTASAPGSNA